MEAHSKHQGGAKGRWKSAVGRWRVSNSSASQRWWTIRSAQLLMDLSMGISLLCRSSLKGPCWKRQGSTEQDKWAIFVCANRFLIIHSVCHWKDNLKWKSSEMSNSLTVDGKICSWPHNLKWSQATEKKSGTMLSYSGGAWAVKKQIWLKTNTTTKKVYSGERRPKALKNWGNRGTNAGETEALLFCTGKCFRVYSANYPLGLKAMGPRGKFGAWAHFTQPFPLSWRRRPLWHSRNAFLCLGTGRRSLVPLVSPCPPTQRQERKRVSAYEPALPSHCCIPRGNQSARAGQREAEWCPPCPEEGQQSEKWGEKGGCSSEKQVVLAWLGGSSTALKRKKGNRLPDTGRERSAYRNLLQPVFTPWRLKFGCPLNAPSF